MEVYKWKWVVLGALGCMSNADLKKKEVNENICLSMSRIPTPEIIPLSKINWYIHTLVMH